MPHQRNRVLNECFKSITPSHAWISRGRKLFRCFRADLSNGLRTPWDVATKRLTFGAILRYRGSMTALNKLQKFCFRSASAITKYGGNSASSYLTSAIMSSRRYMVERMLYLFSGCNVSSGNACTQDANLLITSHSASVFLTNFIKILFWVLLSIQRYNIALKHILEWYDVFC
jgi:hypothetical protein